MKVNIPRTMLNIPFFNETFPTSGYAEINVLADMTLTAPNKNSIIPITARPLTYVPFSILDWFLTSFWFDVAHNNVL